MADLKTPGVYLDKISTGSTPIGGVSTSVCAFMGKAPRGSDSGFTMISSWTDFVQKATAGSNMSVFRDDDYMAYNIYNFYQNGGGRAYFGVIKGEGATKASATLGTSGNTVTFEAKSVGDWANDIKIVIKANALDSTLFDLSIQRTVDSKADVYEQFKALSNDKNDISSYFVNALKSSNIINVTPTGNGALSETTGIILAGGSEGSYTKEVESKPQDITDALYIGAEGLIHKLDSLKDVSLIVSSGESEAVIKGIIDYCTNREDMYAILDSKNTLDVSEVAKFRKSLKGLGELHYPWVYMSDPVTGLTTEVPASGMIAGIYARMDASYGVWRAPAGTEAVLRGALGIVKPLTDGEYETLFEAGVNCILAKPNAGIVLYGARSLNQKYVSDDRLDIYCVKSIKEGTEWAIFELNDENLWRRLRVVIKSFLNDLYTKGAFKGNGEGSSYYVICDSSLNTDANIEKGIVTTEWGYANKKPAEFVVHRLNKVTISGN